MWGPSSRTLKRDGEMVGHGKLRSSSGSLQWIMAPPDIPDVTDEAVEGLQPDIIADGDSTTVVEEGEEAVGDAANGSASKVDITVAK
jgi:hypothetical protein